MAEGTRWNPRYVAYAAAHRVDPATMLQRDREAWPGGHMTGFILWMNTAWKTWFEATNHPRRRDPAAYLRAADHVAFDTWLSADQQTLTATSSRPEEHS